MFERIARRYNLMNRLMTFGQDQRWRRYVVQRAALHPGAWLLDIATGTGDIAFEAQRPRFLDTPELAQGGCRVAESTQARIDQAIRDIVMGVFERAYRILDTNRAVLLYADGRREELPLQSKDAMADRILTAAAQLRARE